MQVGSASTGTRTVVNALTAQGPREEPQWPDQKGDKRVDPGAHEMP